MTYVCFAIDVYVLLVFVRIVASYFPMDPDSGFARAIRTIDLVIEPVLGPLRRALPPVRAGSMAFDLSPIVLLFGAQVLRAIIGC